MTTKYLKKYAPDSGIYAVKGFKAVDDPDHELDGMKYDDEDDELVDFDEEACKDAVFVFTPYNSGQIIFTAIEMRRLTDGCQTSEMPFASDAVFIGLEKFETILVGLTDD